ncbi:hypothetical protein [Mycolicibacterium fluoranthenivorans]|uniref:Uncharacterized protein n=1 Tax=Mycolicibacterium fluoranthenivorans TaxID=258505 RepID=A0A7X5TWG5_9MYCO|nr:hypothetical protein [Mycolicibacterium fluoranthenivorans]MCV7356647.1 hypothetical protein [Mycolicibacterium fluoranthenivorans]NIH94039.1 hypothetical protein [Mycolicibacterium fluoranthenivorans]
MYLRVDTRTTPPDVQVCEPEDFTAFKVVVVTAAHSWVDPADLSELAGRGGDAEWQQKLAAMIDFARSKGWTDESGRIRAHIEPEEETHRD